MSENLDEKMSHMKRIYFDNAATTQVDRRVLTAMKPYFCDIYGNASSLHSFGLASKKALEEARKQIAKKIGAKHNEIVFTSGATEADNLAIRGIIYKGSESGNHIVTTQTEHPAVLETCHFLESQGTRVTYLSVDKFGRIDLKELEKSLGPKTLLVSIIFANNETGVIQSIEEIGRIVKKYNEKNNTNIYFHTDAVQAFTKIDINVKKLNVDLLSISAHKVYGPKGVGVLYIKEGTKIERISHGGHHEYNFRPGTENIASCVGFGKASELFIPESYKKTKKLREYLIDKLKNEILDCYINDPLTSLTTNPVKENVLPNIVNVTIKGAEGEAMMLLLDKEGVSVSTGSACASSSLESSYVLQAMGIPKEEAHGALRISLGINNKKDEIDYFVVHLKRIVAKLRKLNPLI
jgi:cysteine desulfurase